MGNFYWAFYVALPLVVALTGCSAELSKPDRPPQDDFPLPSEANERVLQPPAVPNTPSTDELPAVGRTEQTIRAEQERFQEVGDLLDVIRSADSALLLEGLPHFMWEGPAFVAERERNDVFELGGDYYYEQKLACGSIDIDQLRGILTSDALHPWTGPKNCGGYHADWCIIWVAGDKVVLSEFCFGCGEVTLWSRDNRVICNFWKYETAESLLTHYRHNRPRKEGDKHSD